SLESLTADKEDITIPHEAVISPVMKTEEQKFHARDLFVSLTMKRQGHKFQVRFRDDLPPDPGQRSDNKILHGTPRRLFQAQTTKRDQASDTPRIRHGRIHDFPRGPPHENPILINTIRLQ